MYNNNNSHDMNHQSSKHNHFQSFYLSSDYNALFFSDNCSHNVFNDKCPAKSLPVSNIKSSYLSNKSAVDSSITNLEPQSIKKTETDIEIDSLKTIERLFSKLKRKASRKNYELEETEIDSLIEEIVESYLSSEPIHQEGKKCVIDDFLFSSSFESIITSDSSEFLKKRIPFSATVSESVKKLRNDDLLNRPLDQKNYNQSSLFSNFKKNGKLNNYNSDSPRNASSMSPTEIKKTVKKLISPLDSSNPTNDTVSPRALSLRAFKWWKNSNEIIALNSENNEASFTRKVLPIVSNLTNPSVPKSVFNRKGISENILDNEVVRNQRNMEKNDMKLQVLVPIDSNTNETNNYHERLEESIIKSRKTYKENDDYISYITTNKETINKSIRSTRTLKLRQKLSFFRKDSKV